MKQPNSAKETFKTDAEQDPHAVSLHTLSKMAHIRLRVIESNGKEHQVIWDPDSGFDGLNNAVWVKTGVPHEYQKLFLGGEEIVPPFEMLHIEDGDTLQLVEDKSAGLYASYLDYAAQHENEKTNELENEETDQLVRYLIESAEDDINERVGWDRSTALHKSARSLVSRRIREDLIGVGANCDAVTNDRCTPLHLATFGMRRANPLAAFLCGGANPNAVSAVTNSTPLSYAAWNEISDAVCELIESGAELDATGFYGKNALHNAALCRNPDRALDMLGALLSAGANPDIRFAREDIDKVSPSAFKALNMAFDQ